MAAKGLDLTSRLFYLSPVFQICDMLDEIQRLSATEISGLNRPQLTEMLELLTQEERLIFLEKLDDDQRTQLLEAIPSLFDGLL